VKNWEAEAKVQENDLTRAEGMMKADLITKQGNSTMRATNSTASQFEVEREKQNQQNAEATLRALQLEQEKDAYRRSIRWCGCAPLRPRRAEGLERRQAVLGHCRFFSMKVKFALPEKFAGKVKTGEEITVTSISMPDEKTCSASHDGEPGGGPIQRDH